MRKKVLLWAVVVALLTSFWPVSKASMLDGCEARLNLLLYDTQQATSLSSKDKTTLSQPVRSALEAYNQGKMAEAAQKLNEFQGSLNQFYYTPTPRISAMDFLRLSANVSTTKNCVQPATSKQPTQEVLKDTIR